MSELLQYKGYSRGVVKGALSKAEALDRDEVLEGGDY